MLSSKMSSITELACQHCYAVNRVPTERLGDSPKCGRCHKFLFMGKPMELHELGVKAFLKHNQIPLLVDFWASWCGPCVQMAPAFVEASRTLEPEFLFGKVNTEEHGGLAAQYGIRSLPTIILFANGREVARELGSQSASSIVQWAKSHVPAAA